MPISLSAGLRHVALATLLPLAPSAWAACPSGGEDPLTPDIVAEFEALPQGTPAIEQGVVRYRLKLTNCGADMDEARTMYAKAFLVPKRDYAKSLVGQGVVLETFATSLSLRREQVSFVDLAQELPALAGGDYFLGVTINTRAAPIPAEGPDPMPTPGPTPIPGPGPGPAPAPLAPRPARAPGHHLIADEFVAETIAAQLNNVTPQLFDLGRVDAVVRSPRGGKYDLYHEVANASFNFSSNTAMHRSRNILRIMEGADAIPDHEHWNDDVSARFLFLDLAQGKARVGAYTSQEIDKVWTAIGWRGELDPQGRNIHVDYYSNAPIVSDMEPGKYVLGVIMNVTDRFALDAFPENNLDLTYLQIPRVGNLSLAPEVWFNTTVQRVGAFSASVLKPVDPTSWSVSVENRPEWLELTQSVSEYGLEVYVMVRDDAPFGIHRFNAEVKVTVDGVEQTANTVLQVIHPEGPSLRWRGIGENVILGPTSPGVRLEDRDGVRYMSVTFGMANVGTKPLLYRFQGSDGVVFTTPAERSIAPQAQHDISFTMPLVGVALSRTGSESVTSLYAYVETNVGSHYTNIAYDAKAMLEHR